MNALIVCVEYHDFLMITLDYNRHHFERVMVVTTPRDRNTIVVAEQNDAEVFETEAFYDDGADFNKYKAMELALDQFGRCGGKDGWMCFLDADVMWPKVLPPEVQFQPGFLYSPLCYIMRDLSQPIPEEDDWPKLGMRGNRGEWAGYTQIFHTRDRVLGTPPWHQTDWKHAGGGDSFFQFKWGKRRKKRPPFQVLHLGPQCNNWCGRATPFLDGSAHPDGQARFQKLRQYLTVRKKNKNFKHERVQSKGGE